MDTYHKLGVFMSKQVNRFFILAAILFFAFGTQAQQALYLSGQLGMGQVNVHNSNQDFDTELQFGARAGVLFNDHVAVGAFLQQSNSSDSSFDFDLTAILAEVSFYMNPADEDGPWASLLLGVNRSKSNFAAFDGESDTAFGFSAGYHWNLAANFSLGPQIVYLYTDSDVGPFSQWSVLGNLTFWM
jgi:hypothetical protein